MNGFMLLIRISVVCFWVIVGINCFYEYAYEKGRLASDVDWPRTILKTPLNLKPGTYDLTRTIYLEDGATIGPEVSDAKITIGNAFVASSVPVEVVK